MTDFLNPIGRKRTPIRSPLRNRQGGPASGTADVVSLSLNLSGSKASQSTAAMRPHSGPMIQVNRRAAREKRVHSDLVPL